MENQAKSRITTLESFRFVAAFAVVLFHIHALSKLPDYFGQSILPWAAPGFSGVHFFFVLSGFVIYFSVAERKKIDFTDFCISRFTRLYPALWITLTIMLIGAAATRNAEMLTAITAKDVLFAYLILPTLTEKILAVEWTLRYEIMFYALFALVMLNRKVGLAASALAVGVSIAGFFVVPPGAVKFFFKPYPLLFLTGVLVAMLARRKVMHLPRLAGLAGAGIIAALWAVVPLREELAKNPLVEVFGFGLGYACIIYAAVALENAGKLRSWNALTVLGQASYALYLIHFPVITTIFKINGHFQLLGKGGLIAACCVATVLASLVFHFAIEKPASRAAKAWLKKTFQPALAITR